MPGRDCQSRPGLSIDIKATDLAIRGDCVPSGQLIEYRPILFVGVPTTDIRGDGVIFRDGLQYRVVQCREDFFVGQCRCVWHGFVMALLDERDDGRHRRVDESGYCLLYTSDAADERSSVDLGGR